MKKIKIIIPALFVLTIIAGYFFLKINEKQIPGLVIRNADNWNSSEYLNTQRAVNYYRTEIETDPDNIQNYVELAQIFLQKARITGLDHEYISKAKSLIETALSKNSNHFEALLTHCSILLTLHQFEEAKNIAEKLVSQNPYSSFTYGVLCDAYIELGEYDKAVEACDKMLSIRPDLRSYSRASYIRELSGENDKAIDAMILAADAGVWGHENRAWALYNLGNLYFKEGKHDTAAYIFKGILEERPEYPYALSGLSKIELENKNFKEAELLIKKAYKAAPVHSFLEQLAELYKRSGDKRKANKIIEEVFDEYDHHEKDGYNVELEYARFAAKHNINVEEAHERIKAEYERRPNNIEVRETYASILNIMGKHSEASVISTHKSSIDFLSTKN